MFITTFTTTFILKGSMLVVDKRHKRDVRVSLLNEGRRYASVFSGTRLTKAQSLSVFHVQLRYNIKMSLSSYISPTHWKVCRV